MRLLADMGVAMSTVRALGAAGHDAVHLSDLDLIRLPDIDILRKAMADRRVVAFDLDFGDLMAASGGALPSVITCRLADATPDFVTRRLLDVLQERAVDLEAGAMITVEDTRERIRRLPIRLQE